MSNPNADVPGVQPHATHDIFNQVSPLADYDLFATDAALQEALDREGAGWARARVGALGRDVGRAQTLRWGDEANRHPPQLHTHDAWGRRQDYVEFHPAWHALMELSVRHGVHALPWREPRAGAHVARAAMLRIVSENDFGHACPISMTYSAVPALRQQPELASEWEPRVTSLEYDPSFAPAPRKTGALLGMAMTEKQGGSDVRANTTRATPAGRPGPDQPYLLWGHKWFCSAPMSDAFLVLAQAPAGLSCFFVPRFRPDGTQNPFLLQRLKDKLGNRSNASSEVELDGTWGRLVGEEGRGIPTIMEMVNHTRLDCVIGACAILRRALVHAIHHARQRHAFGRPLIEQPLMLAVLADLALESEAATALMMRLARAYDARSEGAQGGAGPFARIATAIAKYWICKRAPAFVAEALECLGGNGFVESFPLARLYREAPLNSIWEGPGNVICLDVLRAARREPDSLAAVLAEIERVASQEARLARHLERLRSTLAAGELESRGRVCAEQLALALQGALLVEHAPAFVADAFCASRLDGDWGRCYGTLPAGTALTAIVERAFAEPALPSAAS